MRNYEVVTPLDTGGKAAVPPGEIVELDQTEGEPLVAIGALRHAATPKAGRTDRPLHDEPIAELRKIAKREKVEHADDADVPTLAAAIQAARDEKAG